MVSPSHCEAGYLDGPAMSLVQKPERADLAGLGNESSPFDFFRSADFAGKTVAAATVALGVYASLACLPLAMAQGAAIRRRAPLPPPAPPPPPSEGPGPGP